MKAKLEEELYSKFVERTHLLQGQQKRRESPGVKALSDFFGNFTEIAGILELTKAPQSHLIAISASMANLKSSESALGFFSDSFEEMGEFCALEILNLTKIRASASAVKILQYWLEFTFITVIGLLELAKEFKPSKEKEAPPMDIAFRDELLLTLFFYTNYPRILFGKMATALEVKEVSFFTSLCEALTLVFAIVAHSNEEELIKKELGEALGEKIKGSIKELLQGLDKTPDETKEVRAYLELAEAALEKGEIDQLALTLQDMIKKAGYPIEVLFEDISTMKELFNRLKTAYDASHEKTTNMIHMIG